MLLIKKCQFLLYLDLTKIRLEIILKTLQSKKKPFGAIKSGIFQSPKNRIFRKEFTHAFDQKMPISSLFRSDQNKTRNNA